MTAKLTAAVHGVPGVTGETLSFATQANAGGAVSGVIEVRDERTFAEALKSVADALGPDAGRVVVYLSGRTPDGTVIDPETLGLPQHPSGARLRELDQD